MNRAKRVVIVKIGGAATESYQALDCGDCFPEFAECLLKLTEKFSNSPLKHTITKLLENCEYLTVRHKQKIAAMIDAVAIAPECFRCAFTKLKVQGSFGISADITKIKEGHFILAPDLMAMRKQCKITWTKDLWNFVLSKLVLVVKEMRSKSLLARSGMMCMDSSWIQRLKERRLLMYLV